MAMKPNISKRKNGWRAIQTARRDVEEFFAGVDTLAQRETSLPWHMGLGGVARFGSGITGYLGAF